MRLPLLAVLLCAAVGASASGVYVTTWTMRTADRDDFRVEKRQEFVILHVQGLGVHELTKPEAASLGRALLEAAGETEKKCDSGVLRIDCRTHPHLCSTNTPGDDLLNRFYQGEKK